MKVSKSPGHSALLIYIGIDANIPPLVAGELRPLVFDWWQILRFSHFRIASSCCV